MRITATVGISKLRQEVIGFDTDPDRINKLSAQRPSIHEAGLDEGFHELVESADMVIMQHGNK